jgi:hypothetical protein
MAPMKETRSSGSGFDKGVLGYIGIRNIRNTLPKSGTFLLGHPVYIYNYFEYKTPTTLRGIQFLIMGFRNKIRKLNIPQI